MRAACCFGLVRDPKKLLRADFVNYPDESDDVVSGTSNGNYPIPANNLLPLEFWPVRCRVALLFDSTRLRFRHFV